MSTRLAIVRRSAAMTNEGASRWAKRMNIEAVETARIATNRLKGSKRRLRWSLTRKPFVLWKVNQLKL
jgi:hypothetical protein